VERDEDAPDGAASPAYTHDSTHGIRKRGLSQSDSPPCKRQRLPSVTPKHSHSHMNPTPAPDGWSDLSLSQGKPSYPDEVLQPTLQVPVDLDTPVDLSVFDWNSFSDSLAGTAPSTCM